MNKILTKLYLIFIFQVKPHQTPDAKSNTFVTAVICILSIAMSGLYCNFGLMKKAAKEVRVKKEKYQ